MLRTNIAYRGEVVKSRENIAAEQGGIPLRTLNILMIVIVCILAVLLLAVTFRTTGSYRDMREAVESYIKCQHAASSMMEASDYLTEQVREFVVTGNPDSVDNFFTEVNETRRRDNALEELGEHFSDSEVYGYLEKALERSNALLEREYYAMRLTIEAKGYELGTFPRALQEVQLSGGDLALTAEQQSALAVEMVFGTEYQEQTTEIRANVSQCLESLVNATEEQQTGSSDRLRELMRQQTTLIAVLIICFAAMVVLTFCLVIRPLERYVELIRNRQLIPSNGATEMRFLADTYNSMFRQTKRDQDRLSYNASHDDLTGLFNRGVFDKVRDTDDQSSIGLVLVDVDKFKEVNDTYGHDVGDRILKKVADLLRDGFRGDDYVCRIGGDEFAVVLMNVSSEMKDRIRNKMEYANKVLQNPDDDLPAVSLSVGVAFGDRENPTDDIFKDADTALYRVKNSGRAGFGVY